jgi:hypothetical protein
MIELGFELMTSRSDIMLNHHLSQKLKLIRRNEYNHLINTLTIYIKNIGVPHRIYEQMKVVNMKFLWQHFWVLSFQLLTFGAPKVLLHNPRLSSFHSP